MKKPKIKKLFKAVNVMAFLIAKYETISDRSKLKYYCYLNLHFKQPKIVEQFAIKLQNN